MTVGALSLPLSSVLTGQPEVIGHSVLAAAAASISFQFPSVYRAVLVEAYIKRDANAGAVWMRLNGDSGNNYSYQYISATSTTVAGARATAQAQWLLDVTSTIDANSYQSFSALVMKTTAAAKAQLVDVSSYDPAASIGLELTGGEWGNTADLMSRLDVLSASNNFAAGTSISLWGFRY